MQTTHRLLSHARLALGGFVLALLVAASAPWLKPWAAQWVCGAQGPVLLLDAAPNADGAPVGLHGLECALCLLLDTPVAAMHLALRSPTVVGVVLAWPAIEAAYRRQSCAPLPARGPP